MENITENLTCPVEPYAEYNKAPFSWFPPHFRMAEARKVDLIALCAAMEGEKERPSQKSSIIRNKQKNKAAIFGYSQHYWSFFTLAQLKIDWQHLLFKALKNKATLVNLKIT